MSLTTPASTRSLALIRIGFATLVWTTWGTNLVLNYNLLAHEFIAAALLMTTSAMMAVGWWSRTASALTGPGIAYAVFVNDYPQVPFWPDVHVALMIAVPIVLACSPCGRSYSVDRWLALRRSERRGAPIPAELGDVRALGVLTVLAIGSQLILALTMSGSRWLSGYTLERVITWQSSGSAPPTPAVAGLLPWTPLLSALACLCAWALVLAMIHPGTRARAAAVVVAGQLLLYLLFPAGTGPLAMAMICLALVDPQRVHALIEELVIVPTPAGNALD